MSGSEVPTHSRPTNWGRGGGIIQIALVKIRAHLSKTKGREGRMSRATGRAAVQRPSVSNVKTLASGRAAAFKLHCVDFPPFNSMLAWPGHCL